MPIWLRRFTFKKVQEHYESQNKQNTGTSTNDINQARDILKKAQANDPRSKTAAQRSTTEVKVPDFVTSKAKASKK